MKRLHPLNIACWSGLLIAPGIGRGATNAFSGQATGVKATVLGLPTLTLSDTGTLESIGDVREASLLQGSVTGLLAAEVLHASTIGQGDRSH